MARWIDTPDFSELSSVGSIGYLVEVFNTSNAFERVRLQERPQRTNRSHAPVLVGWCGESNNMSATACGVWRITRQNRDRDRSQIVEVTGAERAKFLTGDGYPELVPENERHLIPEDVASD